MGYLGRELRWPLAICSMSVLLGGCFLFGEETSDRLVLDVTSPETNAEFRDEAIAIEFELAGNLYGATVTFAIRDVGGSITVTDQVTLAPRENAGEITMTPASSSGYIFIDATAVSNADPVNTSAGRIGILWNAPWQIAPIEACVGSTCAPITDDTELSGEAHLTVRPAWDGNLLERSELTIDGVAPENLETFNQGAWWFDTEVYGDGQVTLMGTVKRNDGLERSITRLIDIANCPRARPNAQYYLAAYAADGNLTTAASEITFHDLHDGTSGGVDVVNGDATALAIDEVEDRVYFGVASTPPGYHRFDYTTSFGGKATIGGVGTPVLSIAVGADGYVYWTEGVRGATPAGAIWRKDVDLIAGAARVDVGGLPGADGLVFDTDGTLLVAAGATIHRLTLTAGVETARAPVYTRAGAMLTLIARDDQGRLYVTDKAAGELVRYTLAPTGAEVLYTQPDWTVGGMHEPWSLSFLEYPQRCHGLLITRQGLDDARRVVDVGDVRGTP